MQSSVYIDWIKDNDLGLELFCDLASQKQKKTVFKNTFDLILS